LQLKTTGDEVWALQQYLNTHGFPVALSGAGSSGQETSYFGPATQAALAKYQAAKGIAPAAGYFGPKTRAAISGDTQTATALPASAAATPASADTSVFTRDLMLGDVGTDVQALQRYLNAHGFILANSGPGAPGNETQKFGDVTKYQLSQFQQANAITPAAGYLGPKTRAFINK
jgi:peptidoglycan hydrolase-like protein with peptidoglycan-binding domain